MTLGGAGSWSEISHWGGAVVMNGKGIYGSSVPWYTYHGISTKKVEFICISATGSCLG